jgi:serine protease
VSLTIHGSDSGRAALSYSATGLPAGLRINAGTGVISGTPTATQTTTVTARATDGFTNTGSTTFTWTVVVPGAPQLSTVHRLTGLAKGKPKVGFALAAGAFAPALKSVTIRLPRGLSFARGPKVLAKGTAVRSSPGKVPLALALRGGALTITFRAAAAKASVTIGVPAITISESEWARVRAHKVHKLVLRLRATDASRRSTSFSVAFTRLS